MDPFVYTQPPIRVRFGSGALQHLAHEVSLLNLQRPLILSGPRGKEQAAACSTLLEHKTSGTYSNATMHTPLGITDEALALARRNGADGFLSVGGGSAIGLGKALSVRLGLPHIAVPTTYSGSEMTASLGEQQGGRKVHRNEPRVRPDTVIYDVDLTLSLPAELSVTSGINAVAHAGA